MADWNLLFGELRKALQERNWSVAGDVAWQMRKLDVQRYGELLEDYIAESCKIQGYPMMLETEQRLAAIRAWARTAAKQGPDARALLANLTSFQGKVSQMDFDRTFGRDAAHLLDLRFGGTGNHMLERPEIRDVIWAVLQDYTSTDDKT